MQTIPTALAQRARRGALALAAALACTPVAALDVTWLGGTGDWSSAGWSTGLFPGAGPHVAFIDGGNVLASLVRLDVDVTLAGLDLSAGDALRVLDARRLVMAGGSITVNGQLEFASVGNFTYLDLQGDLTLGGSGQTVMGPNIRNGMAGNGHQLTIVAGHTVQGGGSFGGNGYAAFSGFVNHGSLAVDAAGSGMTLATSGGSFQNLGSVSVANDSTLTVINTSFSGGTLTGTGSAALAGGTFNNLTLAGTLRVNDAQIVSLSGTINNTGTLTVAGVGNFTYLQLAADTTLAGNGQTVFGDHFRNGISGDGHVLGIAAGHTLAGGGSIGGNGYAAPSGVTNQGTIRVDAPAFGMRIETAGGTLVQSGAGQVQVENGSTFYLVNTVLSGGQVSGSGTAGLAGGGVFSDTTMAGSLNVNDAQIIGLSGTVTNTGTLTVAGVGNFTYMRLAGDTVLAGSGQTVLGDHFRNGISGDGHVLGIGAGHTLAGGGSIGGNGYAAPSGVTNQGTIRVDAPSFGMRIETAGGTLVQSGAGQVQVQSGSTFYLVNTVLSGGQVSGSGTAGLAGGGVFSDTTMSGSLNVNDNQIIGLAGTVTNNGTLTVSGVGNFTYMRLAGDTVLAGSGQTVLGDHFRNGISGDGHVLGIGAGHTLAGGGSIGGNGYAAPSGVTNQGTIRVDAPAFGMRIETAGGTLVQSGAGQVQVESGSTFYLVNTVLSGGRVSGSGTAGLGGGGVFSNALFSGALNVNDNQNIGLSGTVTGIGSLTVSGVGNFTYARLAGDTVLAGSGQTVLGDHFRNGISGDGHVLRIAADHTLQGGGSVGTNGYTQPGQFINEGRLLVDAPSFGMRVAAADGQLQNAGLVQVQAGSTLSLDGGVLVQTGAAAVTRVDGRLEANQVQLNGGRLQGTGTVAAAVVTAGAAATVAPGNSVGKLSIQGSLTLAAGSQLQIEAAGLAQGLSYDWLFVGGNTSLGGALMLDIAYAAHVGDSFVVLSSDSGSVSGSFDSVTAAGWEVSTTYADHSVTVTLTAAAVPEPATAGLLALGIVGLLGRVRRRGSVHPAPV